ncbi:MAG: LLM class flavin-dependent oxidoreductase [Rhodobacteraceae bacterium]|nr:LLM class flavin-dependent oxidoreductase [Paracoccaceae bacterium]
MTQSPVTSFSCIVVGNESLLIQCSEVLLQHGHTIRAVVSDRPDITRWAKSKDLPVVKTTSDVEVDFDWLFSISNLTIIPADVLAQAKFGAVNFHDGPLPRYAGLNAPVWAILNREKRHGITWHLMQNGVDEGDIIEQRMFDIAENDTALTLNTKCFAAAIDSFTPMLEKLETSAPSLTKQDLSQRQYFAKNDRPDAAGRLDFNNPAEALIALVRGLDHGGYWNPLTCAKIEVAGQILLVAEAESTPLTAADAKPGVVQSVSEDSITVVTSFGAIRLGPVSTQSGQAVKINDLAKEGDVLASLSAEQAAVLTTQTAVLAKSDGYWHQRFIALTPALLPQATASKSDPEYARCDLNISKIPSDDRFLAIAAAWVARLNTAAKVDLAFQDETTFENTNDAYHAQWVPLGFDTSKGGFEAAISDFLNTLNKARKHRTYAHDLLVRDPRIDANIMPQVGLSVGAASGAIAETCLTVALKDNKATLHYDTTRMSVDTAKRLAAQLEQLVHNGAADDTPIHQLPILPEAEQVQVLQAWNNTETDSPNQCIHHLFEAQVAKTPDATALVFKGESLTYEALNTAANRAAHVLREMGIKPGTVVGLFTKRSLDMMIGALAIQKAGGAYVPLDPSYPKNRIAHFIKDSGTPVIVATSDLLVDLPDHNAQVLVLDTDARIQSAPAANIDSGVTPQDLAYLIYTSGSTGQPKGVMVEHANVSNFFTGMDAKISHNPPGVWLAVTSLSFDISVLELFYTLARGFKVVLNSDESRVMASNDTLAISDQKMDFSLYFWGNDDGIGRDKYKLLLEGAKYADKNGFCAVWTPERHFHAFGGPYPNPAVTGAAVAAVTENLSVRSGSCVAPLHHTARIAEEWAVIDNLTNGRAGLGIASGWQPDDFVLRPENAPPNNKSAMFQSIKDLRALWRGETVDFPTKDGGTFAVATQPRPVSKHLPIWVTIAGNPDTWREAGEIGANVLTHLLGQTIEEVSDRIALYHGALRKAGHDPADHTITLMLHSFVGQDREKVRETARGPMKAYMGAAAGLIRQCAWDFPAFKRPKGINSPFEIDLATLGADEVDAILEFAFERYFEDAGLFGTVEDALKRVEKLKTIGVGEVACLIDYGIPVNEVLDSLVPLAEVLKKANTPSELAIDDFSIAAQVARHKVTHLQCTPSMARMLVADDATHMALRGVQQVLIGGEPLPGTLAAEIAKITDAPVENMYGPTETTIWSSTESAQACDGLVNIGHPIGNTQLYVLGEGQTPQPIGIPGELYIGGAGVTRGYWNRPELTAERYLDNPFTGKGRIYRTGDLVSRRADGKIAFLGRVDNQVKLRGHRIELGEIETYLEGHKNVTQAVVTAREVGAEDTRLVAYLIGSPVPDAELRDYLAASLPDYMMPSHFVILDTMPLTPNKKVDRNALPEPQLAKVQARTVVHTAPENNTEQQIAAIWTDILGTSKIGSGDNFFDLGGHSLLAVQAHREIKAALNVAKLSITDIFRFPVLSALAARIDGDNPEGKPQKPTADVAHQAQQRSDAMSKRRAMRARRGGA